MRISLLSLVLAFVGVWVVLGLAPTSEDFHKLYGQSSNVIAGSNGSPVSESFILYTNIRLVAQYGSDRQACFLDLEPEPSVYPASERDHELLMSNNRISDILEQAIPSDKRGRPLPGGEAMFCAGSLGVRFQDYENVYIQHAVRCMQGSDSEGHVRVWFKRSTCPKPDWYPRKSPVEAR
jgi:hypothetical protein